MPVTRVLALWLTHERVLSAWCSGIGDLYRIYLYTQRNNIDYNVAYIPNDFRGVAKTMFDKDYMQSLFDLAYEQSSRGYRWHKRPPGMDARAE